MTDTNTKMSDVTTQGDLGLQFLNAAAEAFYAGEYGQTIRMASHAAIESAADIEPPLVALPVAGEKRRLGLLARAVRRGEAMLGEVAQRGMQHRIAGAVAAVVVGGQAARLTGAPGAQPGLEGGRRGCEADGHPAPLAGRR